MSHFTVLVIGPNPEEQLAPFDENLDVETYEEDGETYHRNPQAKWDWYSIGGRWTGFLKLKPGAEGLVGRPGAFSNQAKKGFVDQTQLKNVDLQGMRDDAAKKYSAVYDKLMELTGNKGLPELKLTWESLSADTKLSWEARREIYHAQEAVVALNEVNKKAHALIDRSNPECPYLILSWANNQNLYSLPRQEFIQSARDQAFVPFAVLKDGQWFEKGEMGWWGMVSDEKDQSAWNLQFADLIDNLDPETLITCIDCHI